MIRKHSCLSNELISMAVSLSNQEQKILSRNVLPPAEIVFSHPPTTRDFFGTTRPGPARPAPARPDSARPDPALGTTRPGPARPDQARPALHSHRKAAPPFGRTHTPCYTRHPQGFAGPIRFPLRLAQVCSGPQDRRPQHAPARLGMSVLTRISHGSHG